MTDYVEHQECSKVPDSLDDPRLVLALNLPEDWSDASSSSTHSINSPIDLSPPSTWDSDSDEASEDLGSELTKSSATSLTVEEVSRFDDAPSSLRDFCHRLVRRALSDPGLLEPFSEIHALLTSSTTNDDQLSVNDITPRLYLHLYDVFSSQCTNTEEKEPEECTSMPDETSFNFNQSSPVDNKVVDLCSHPMRILYGNVWDEFQNDAPTILNSHALLTNALDETLRLKEHEEQDQDQDQEGQNPKPRNNEDDCVLLESADLDTPSVQPEETIHEKENPLSFLQVSNLPLFVIFCFFIVLFLLGSFGHLSGTLLPIRRPIFIVTDFWDDLYLWLKFGIDPSGNTGRLLVAFQPYSLLDRLIALLCIS